MFAEMLYLVNNMEKRTSGPGVLLDSGAYADKSLNLSVWKMDGTIVQNLMESGEFAVDMNLGTRHLCYLFLLTWFR